MPWRADATAFGTGACRASFRNWPFGKTYLACALGQQACRQGYRTLFARADGTYATLLGRLARIDCLILDDWGLGTLTELQRQDLLEVMEDRDAARSTVITSQLPRDDWHVFLGDPTVADAFRQGPDGTGTQRAIRAALP